MYLDFFKLKELPFRLTADPRYYFLGASQEQAKVGIRNSLPETNGCILLSGEAGVGKTILLQDLLASVSDRYTQVQIRHPEMSVIEFYQAVLAQLEEPTDVTEPTLLIAKFEASLMRRAGKQQVVLLIIDNGELLSGDLLAEILRIPRRGNQRNVRLIVAARPALLTAIDSGRPDMRASTVAAHVVLTPLRESESRRYLEHRLVVAARQPVSIFESESFVEFQRYTGGVPRTLNILADTALILAFNRSRERVSAVDVRSAVDQLQWVEFNSRAQPKEGVATSGAYAETAQDEEAGAAHIRIYRGDELITDLDLPMGKITIGRAKNNDIRIESQFVSRHHCQILTTAQYSVIEDLQSQNGIVFGSRRVSVHRLQGGDQICIGEHRLEFVKVRRELPDNVSVLPIAASEQVKSTDVENTHLMRSSLELAGWEGPGPE